MVGASAQAIEVRPKEADSDAEGAFRANAVGQVPGEQQQRCEQQGIAVDHPLLPHRAAAQLTFDLGDRDVDDQDVQRDQEEPGRGQQHRPPGACWISIERSVVAIERGVG